MNTARRLNYLDALKGLGIFFVVYHHFVVMGMRDSGYISPVNNIIIMFFMPLFFFISGYLSTKHLEKITAHDIYKYAWKRSETLLLPTIVMFALCMIYFRLDVLHWLSVSFKCGYWFTWALFLISILWMLSNAVCRHKALGGVCAIVIYLVGIKINEGTSFIVGYLSLDFVFQYYIFYVAGSLLKTYENKFHATLSNRYFIALLFVLSLLPVFISVPSVVALCFKLPQVYTLYWLFKSHESYFNNGHTCGKALCCLGRYSLDIYLIHYFLLFKIDFICDFLSRYSSDYCFRGHSCQFLVEMVLVGVIALSVAFIAVFISKVIRTFPIISKLCLGH